MGKSNLKYLKMAKSKNHTSHNQGYKNHRNGIYRPKKERYVSNAMMNQKLIRNTRRARKFDPSIVKNKTLTKRVELRKTIKAKVIEKLREKRVNKLLGVKPASKKDDKKDDKKGKDAKAAPKKK